MKQIEITSNSNTISATLFESQKEDTVLIIASATGVKQEYYFQFSQYVSDRGVSVITFDYNGIGRSLTKPIGEVSSNAADWGMSDLESIIQYVLKNYANSKKVILGHSIGGQLIGLAQSSTKIDKIILVAAQSGYWKFWKGVGRIKMWFNWYILFPILIKLFGFLNSKKLSGMENLPKNVANQWRNWGKNSDYILSDTTITSKYYENIVVEITSFSIDDDDFAPKEAVKWMTNQYRNSKIQHRHLNPNDFQVSKIGHFGVFKKKFESSIWRVFFDEI